MSSSLHVPAGEERLITVSPLTTHTHTLSYIHTSGGFRRGKGRLVMYFCVHNCTSPSNDYAGVACSNNNQAQLQFLTDLETFD